MATVNTVNKEHKKKRKAKQVAERKKSVSVMLKAGIKDLIDKERKGTGETIAAVIERAVSTLLGSATAGSINEDGSAAGSEKLDLIRKHPHGSRIYELVGMYHHTGATAKSIATALSLGKFQTFSGNKEWTEEDVNEILDVVEHDRPLFDKIVDNP